MTKSANIPHKNTIVILNKDTDNLHFVTARNDDRTADEIREEFLNPNKNTFIRKDKSIFIVNDKTTFDIIKYPSEWRKDEAICRKIAIRETLKLLGKELLTVKKHIQMERSKYEN